MLILFLVFSFIHSDTLSILQEFYNATNGNYWLDNTGWNTTVIEDFNGIEVDSDGNVVTLFLTGNNLTGYLPSSLGDLITLTDIEIAKNNLSGKLPDFSRLVGLQIFDIHFNNFTDVFPTYFYDFKKLIQLDVGYNNFTGTLAASVSNWDKLQFLGVANNSFSGPIPSFFPVGLVRLWLSGNAFSGPIPSSLSSLVNIEILDLSRNSFSGPVPDIFGEFSAAKDILLNSNQLEGVLPAESIMRLTRLSVLGIHGNRFTALPAGIFGHPTLFAFTAQDNLITGEFPAGDVNTTGIVYANLSGSAFDGPIPSWALWTEAGSADGDGDRGRRMENGGKQEIVPLHTADKKKDRRRAGRGKFSFANSKNGKRTAADDGGDDGKVLMETFGYSKCPGCVGLEDEVQKIPADVYPLFDLHMYNFAVVNDEYPAHWWSMHGQGEAFGDFATQCAIHLADNQSQWLSFTACVNDEYDFDDVPINTAVCADKAGFNWEAFKTCVRKNGVDYVAEGTSRQQAYNVIWSPTLFFNGVQGDGLGDVDYLVQTICRLYRGTEALPPSCS